MTLEELIAPLTREEAEAALLSALAASGVDASTWKDGSVTRAIVTGTAIVLSALSRLQALLARSSWLEYAEEDWLTLVARYVYDVERNTGTFATGTLVADNASGNLYLLDAGDLVAVSGSHSYRSTEAVTINPSETGVVIPVQCTTIGSAGTRTAGTITTLETTLLGVTVTNPTALVGADPESNPALRTRCYAKTGTLSPNGPADAYRFLALSARKDDGSTANVTRVTATPDGTGHVQVYVASATGAVSGTVGDTTTDLGAVDESIQTLAVPLAVTATVESAVALPIAVTYSAWVRNTIGVTAEEVETRIGIALAEYLSTSPIGGYRKTGDASRRVYVEALEGVIAEAIGTRYVIDLSTSAPAASVVVAANEAPVLGTLTATVTLEAP